MSINNYRNTTLKTSSNGTIVVTIVIILLIMLSISIGGTMGIAGFIISTILAVWVVIKEIRDHIEWNTIHNPLRMNIIHVQNGTKYLSYEYSEYKLKIPTIDEQVIGLRIEAKKELSLSKIQIRLVAGNKRWPSLRRHHPTLKNIIGYLSILRPYSRPKEIFNPQTHSVLDMLNISIGEVV